MSDVLVGRDVKVSIHADGTLEFTDGEMFVSFYEKNGENIVASFSIDCDNGEVQEFVELERIVGGSFSDVISLFDRAFNLND